MVIVGKSLTTFVLISSRVVPFIVVASRLLMPVMEASSVAFDGLSNCRTGNRESGYGLHKTYCGRARDGDLHGLDSSSIVSSITFMVVTAITAGGNCHGGDSDLLCVGDR